MEIEQIKELSSNLNEFHDKIIAAAPKTNVLKYLEQYDVAKHAVMDETVRRKKEFGGDDGSIEIVDVTRVPVPFQKRIVRYRAAFLCGNPIELVYNTEDQTERDLAEMVQRVWDNNKLDYKGKALAKGMMSETQVAELWYTVDVDEDYWIGSPSEGRLKKAPRVKLLAKSRGDDLYPVYDKTGDMVAFGRGYTVLLEADKKEEHFDVYTADTIYYCVKTDAGWGPGEIASLANPAKKIPIIYYAQPLPEWNDQQRAIERYETAVSNLGDNNDYFGAPIITLEGEVKGFAKKGERGKVIQLDPGAKMGSLSWPQSPESVMQELTELRSIIYNGSDTPDLSIENMSRLGTFSGIALKLLFMPAHMAAADKEEIFGECIQRRINYLKSTLALLDLKYKDVQNMSIKPKFEYYLPKNELETIEMLNTATGGKATMSQETAIERNPLVENPEVELEKVLNEAVVTDVNTPI